MSILKQLSVCAAACGVAMSANAQSSVNIYGLLDLAVEHLTNAGAPGGAITRVPALTGTLPSRLGFRGTEDLGGGLNAVFTLEMGIAPDNGSLNQGGRAFGRQSYVGLSGPWGSITVGRQYTALFYGLLDSDVMGPNMFGSASFDPYIPNTRADNSIAYLGKFNGWTVGGTYSLGRDVVNAGPSPAGTNCPGESPTDSKACREWSLLTKYDARQWGAAMAVDEFRGGPGAFGGLTSSAMKDRRVTLNGYFNIGRAKVGGGLLRRKNDASATAPNSDLWFLGAAYRISDALVIDGEVFRYRLKGTADGGKLAALRATYSLSKRTAVYVTAGRILNEGASNFSVSGSQPGGNPIAGGAQSGFAIGLRHAF